MHEFRHACTLPSTQFTPEARPSSRLKAWGFLIPYRGLLKQPWQHPRRFDIGRLFKTLDSVAMQSYSIFGGRKRSNRHFAGRGAVEGHRPGALSSEDNHLQGAAAEHPPLGWVFTASRRRSYQLRRRREAILERETNLRVFSCVIGSPRDGHPNNLRLIEIRQRTAAAGLDPNNFVVSKLMSKYRDLNSDADPQ